MKFHIRTLGCKMNQLDSARIAAALQGAGHQPVTDETEAEVVLVNSCTVTAQSDRKSRQAANGARRGHKQVAVLGCGPRADPAGWRARMPDTLLFEHEDDLLAHFGVDGQAAPFPVTSRTRLPVAIQTGCDDTCTFCITRIARGPHRSHSTERIVAHVGEAHAKGVREVVLTGINQAAWGAGNTKRPSESRLHELLEAILARTDMPRIRLSSLGPQYLGDGFFAVFTEPRVCDHLHLSVQSGSPTVLARMDRGHDAEVIYRVAGQARQVRPDVALTADFIVGFPGESEAEFGETLAMVERIGFAKLHVFPYSPRAGTPAAVMPGQLPQEEKKRRAALLREAGRDARSRFLDSQMGKSARVLVEQDGTGFSGNYIRIRVPGISEGRIHEARIAPATIADRW